jgi:hypothetical protein
VSETDIQVGSVFCTQVGDMCPQTDILRRIEAKVDANGKDTAAIKQWLQGDPANPNSPGMLMRLDRLEQDHEKNKWLARTAMGAALAAVIQGFVALMKK